MNERNRSEDTDDPEPVAPPAHDADHGQGEHHDISDTERGEVRDPGPARKVRARHLTAPGEKRNPPDSCECSGTAEDRKDASQGHPGIRCEMDDHHCQGTDPHEPRRERMRAHRCSHHHRSGDPEPAVADHRREQGQCADRQGHPDRMTVLPCDRATEVPPEVVPIVEAEHEGGDGHQRRGREREAPGARECIRHHRQRDDPSDDRDLHRDAVGEYLIEPDGQQRGKDRIEAVGREACEPVPTPAGELRQECPGDKVRAPAV
jgi:hypothetical protein